MVTIAAEHETVIVILTVLI